VSGIRSASRVAATVSGFSMVFHQGYDETC
jgi:hypothetical protein